MINIPLSPLRNVSGCLALTPAFNELIWSFFTPLQSSSILNKPRCHLIIADILQLKGQSATSLFGLTQLKRETGAKGARPACLSDKKSSLQSLISFETHYMSAALAFNIQLPGLQHFMNPTSYPPALFARRTAHGEARPFQYAEHPF